MLRSVTRPFLLALLSACLFFCGCSLFQPAQGPAPAATPLRLACLPPYAFPYPQDRQSGMDLLSGSV